MNKNFFTISAFSLLTIFGSINAKAQSQNTEKVGTYVTHEMSFLSMTPDQSHRVYQINLKAVSDLENLDQKSFAENSSQAENMQGLAQILKTRNTSLQEVLSPAQYELFQKNKIARGASFRTMIMSQMLDLTNDQLEPVFNINQKVVKEVRQDLDAYFSADKNSGKKNAHRKLQKSLKKTDKDFDKILSPQQIKIYHENTDFLREVLREESGIKSLF